MNEEEKKAVEYTENCLMKITMGMDCEFDVNILDALVNIIKKLQKENEYYKLLLDTNKNFTIDKKNGNYKWNVIEIQKVKDKIEKYKNMCISNVKGYENYFKDNYNELVFRRMEQLEKELLESEE